MTTRTPSGRRLNQLGLVTFCVWYLYTGIFSVARAGTNVFRALPQVDLANDLVNASFDGDNQKVSLLLTNVSDVNPRIGPGVDGLAGGEAQGTC